MRAIVLGTVVAGERALRYPQELYGVCVCLHWECDLVLVALNTTFALQPPRNKHTGQAISCAQRGSIS